jgi:hypothetical protein
VKGVDDLFLLAEILNTSHRILDLHGLPPFFMVYSFFEKVFVLELIYAFLHLELLFIPFVFFKRSCFLLSSFSIALFS